MGHVVRVYKQALFRNHGLLSSIPPFTLVEAQLCESILGSISAKHPRFRPFVARVCPSTPHSVTSNQGGGTSATVVDQNGLQWWRMDCLCGTNMDCGRALASHILVAAGLIELQSFPDDAFHSNIYGSWNIYRLYDVCVNPHMKNTYRSIKTFQRSIKYCCLLP